MAVYFPCPWCGVDVTPTPPPKATPEGGSTHQIQNGKTLVLWDRNGGKHTKGGCPPMKLPKT
jgi:hypothetical protein